MRLLFRERRWRLRWSRMGVTRRWILGLYQREDTLVNGRTGIQGEYNIRLGVWLRSFLLLAGDLPSDDKLAHVILLLEVEEFADLGRTLGAEAFGEDGVGEAGNLLLALLNHDEGEDGNVGTNDAPANRLALALASATGPVAGVPVREQESDTMREEDTLLHWETLFIISPCDAEDVALEFITDRVSRDFL